MTSGNSQYVYIVENGDTAKYVEVTTGLTGTGVTEITSGLEAGQLPEAMDLLANIFKE